MSFSDRGLEAIMEAKLGRYAAPPTSREDRLSAPTRPGQRI
ncbi:hypothetical protein [Bittarella sp. HCP28S3_D9]